MPAAASSALAPLCRGMSGRAPGPPLGVLFRAPGMPNATFLPSISMVAPSSFAAVNLYSVRCDDGEIRCVCVIPSVHKTIGNGVRADTEWSPFFRDGLSETHDSSLCSGIINLANVPMETGYRRDVDDRTVFRDFTLRVCYYTTMTTGPSKLERTLTRK